MPDYLTSVSCILAQVMNAVSEEMLPGVELNEVSIVAAREQIRSIVHKNLDAPNRLLEAFEEYSWMLELQEDKYVEDLNQSLEETEKEICRFKQVL